MGKTKNNYNYERGIKAENFFSAMLNSKGISHTYENEWFDFLVNGQKVEVKSCSLSCRDSKDTLRKGRFDFSIPESNEKMFNENIWICFVLRHREDFMLLGFCRAQKLEKRRWINLGNMEKLGIICFADWVKEILK